MKISIIGSGRKETVIQHSQITKEELSSLISELGTYLASISAEIIIVPDEGIPFEIAKSYKEAGGHHIIGLVPLWDKKFGINHIQDFLSILDKKVNLKSWYEADGEIASFGDICVCIGFSPGVLTEICMMKYHSKFFDKKTPLIIFENTVSERLPKEVEDQIPECIYVKSIEELADFIQERFFQ